MWKPLIIATAFLLVACSEQNSAVIGDNAPKISARQLNGDSLNEQALEGKAMVLAFFKNGCASCVKDLPKLNILAFEQADRLNVIAIDALDTADVIADMMRRFGWNNMIVLKDDLAITSKRYGVVVTPTLILVDKHGVIQARIIGERPWDDTKRELDKLL